MMFCDGSARLKSSPERQAWNGIFKVNTMYKHEVFWNQNRVLDQTLDGDVEKFLDFLFIEVYNLKSFLQEENGTTTYIQKGRRKLPLHNVNSHIQTEPLCAPWKEDNKERQMVYSAVFLFFLCRLAVVSLLLMFNFISYAHQKIS